MPYKRKERFNYLEQRMFHKRFLAKMENIKNSWKPCMIY